MFASRRLSASSTSKSRYGTARTYAETLAFDRGAALLPETLDKERAADGKLSWIARQFVNPQSIRSARPH